MSCDGELYGKIKLDTFESIQVGILTNGSSKTVKEGMNLNINSQSSLSSQEK